MPSSARSQQVAFTDYSSDRCTAQCRASPGRRAVKTAGYLFFTVGLLGFITLVGYYGAAEIGAAVLQVGWGLVLVTLFHLVPMAADTVAWAYLLGPRRGAEFGDLLWMRWIKESVSTLLPVAQVGGDLVRLRLAVQRGLSGRIVVASLLVEFTTSLLALVLFCVVGVALLFERGVAADTLNILSLGLAVSFLLVLGLYLLLRLGLFNSLLSVLMRMGHAQKWAQLAGGAAALDEGIRRIYARRRDVFTSSAWAFVGWALGAGEVWLTLHFLRAPVDFADAVILESLIHAVRNAAFMVAAAVGVQEGGLVVLGAMIGLTPDTAIALSLVKRVRELALGVPGLLAWHFAESRRLLRSVPREGK